MNATTTTALLGICTAVLVLGVQRHRVVSLEERAEEVRQEIAILERPGASNGSQFSSSRPSPERSDSTPSERPDRSSPSSAVDVETIHTRVVSWLKLKDFNSQRAKEIVANISELLEIVGDCRGEDLQRLVELLGGFEDQRNPAAMVAIVLQMLAVEHDPLRYLRPDPTNASQIEVELQSAALSALGRRDPEAAMSWLLEHSDKIDDRLRGSGYAAVCAQALRRDLGAAVQFLSQLDPHHRQTTLARLTTTGIRESRKLIEAARELPDEGVRRDFMEAAVASIMAHEGIEAGRTALEPISDSADYSEIVKHAAGVAVDSRPAETMNWLLDAESGGPEAKAVEVAMASWARRDYQAAAEWLTSQSSSPNRDLAIQSFAQTIQQLDPEAATIWAAEITDPSLREPVLRANLEHWKAKEPNAAAEWEAKQ